MRVKNARCKNCRHSHEEHVDGKCLYASTRFEFWACAGEKHGPLQTYYSDVFHMGNRIAHSEDGHDYHVHCVHGGYRWYEIEGLPQ